MDNMQQNGGIPEIGSMSMGNRTTAGSARKKRIMSSGISVGTIPEKKLLMILAGVVIGVVLLFIVVPRVLEGAEKRKAVNAAESYGTYALNMLNMDFDDIEWEQYYPDEIAKKMEKEIENAKKSVDMMSSDELEEFRKMKEVDMTMEVSLISKLGRKYNDSLSDIAREWTNNEMGLSLSKKDFKVSKGYTILVKMDVSYNGDDKTSWMNFLVLKVNGRYGVYMPMVLE